MDHARRAAIFIALMALAAHVASGLEWKTSSGGLKYAVSIEPPRPQVGALAVLELSVQGISASSSRVAEFRLGAGLALESESIRPIVSASSRGAAFRFELRLLEAGDYRIESLAIIASEGGLRLGPIVVREASVELSESAAAWRWVAPPDAIRFEAFEARLVPLSGGTRDGLSATFSPPSGASFEASGPLSWIVIAFEEGELILPHVSLEKGRGSGVANAARVEIVALPAEIGSTRALGRFTLSLKGPELAGLDPGAALRFRLVLEGRGNLPVVALPEPWIRLDGALLPRDAWSSSRVDDARAEGGSYVGSTSLVVEVRPERPGRLSLRFPPVAVFDPRSGAAKLEVPSLELRVGHAASRAAKPASGDGGRALAELFGTLRRAPPLSREARAARKAALVRASELGTGPPLLDALPPPAYFFWPAFTVALTGLSLFSVSRLRARKASAGAPLRHAALAAGGALLALSIALCSLGFASAAERKERFAVIWTDSLQTVPSDASEHPVAVVKGSTARTRGISGAFESVVLGDGVEGWAPRDSLFWY
jgi:hypothetical protein